MAQNILDVFNGLGGLGWLLEWAKANQTQFITVCLARLMPAFPKENPDIQINTQINNGLDAGTDLDAARRVAFLLAKAAHDLDDASGTELEAYRYQPAQPYEVTCDPQAACHVEPDPAREAWAETLAQTPEEQLVRNTKTCTIENYPGSAAERGVPTPKRRR
jgi:hypothetical protein